MLKDPGSIRQNVEAQRALILADIDSRAKTAKNEIDILEDRNTLTEMEIKGFKNHVDGMAKVLAADITARKKALEGDSFASGVAARARQATDPALVEAITNATGVNFISQVGRDQNLTEDQARIVSNLLETASIAPQITTELQTLADGLGTFDFQGTRDAIDAAAAAEKKI